MRDDDYPTPISDPAAEGLPETADDDSTAYDEVNTGREADGLDPAALPSDVPLAMDRFGTTAEEQRIGESLDDRLAQEVPDVSADDPLGAPGSALADEAVSEEAAAQAQLDADVLDPGPQYDPDTKVSLYDRPLEGTVGAPVGRLVEPDQGGLFDTEADAVATDAGAAGGGASAEELAVHEFIPPA
ncbi:MAG TPA: DUF5709 domain-containing protein [Pilimelia sp.]|nr:DUF5709 domain-containing protein [Pilimelia sp.]